MTVFGVKISGLIRGGRCDLRLRAFWAWVAMAMSSETLVQVSPALPGFERKMSILLQAVERCNLLWKCRVSVSAKSPCRSCVRSAFEEVQAAAASGEGGKDSPSSSFRDNIDFTSTPIRVKHLAWYVRLWAPRIFPSNSTMKRCNVGAPNSQLSVW